MDAHLERNSDFPELVTNDLHSQIYREEQNKNRRKPSRGD